METASKAAQKLVQQTRQRSNQANQTSNGSKKTTRPSEGQCSICQGDNFIVEEDPYINAGIPRSIPCPNGCRAPNHNAKLQNISGITDRKKSVSLDVQWHPAMQPAVDTVQRILDDEVPSGFVFMSGNYGCGKSHILIATINAAIQQGHSALYIEAESLLDALRSTFSKESDITMLDLLERLTEVKFLAIDELDRINNTDFAMTKLFHILNTRYQNSIYADSDGSQVTLMAANAKLHELEGYLQSRLTDSYSNVFNLWNAPDYRALRKQFA